MRTRTNTKTTNTEYVAEQASTVGSTPAARLLEGDPPRLRLTARREEARAKLADGWRPPLPSRATRTWSPTSQGCGRATMAVHGDILGEAESIGEFKLLKVVAADPRVATFQEQPDGVTYQDGSSERRHVADVLVETRDGRRIALDYRPERRAAPVRRVTRLLNERRPGDVDAWVHVGDAKLPRDLVRRADLILTVRRDGPRADDAAVARMRAVVDRPMSVDDAVARSGLGGLGFRAMVHLIDIGILRISGGYRIDYGETVEPVRAHAKVAS